MLTNLKEKRYYLRMVHLSMQYALMACDPLKYIQHFRYTQQQPQFYVLLSTSAKW